MAMSPPCFILQACPLDIGGSSRTTWMHYYMQGIQLMDSLDTPEPLNAVLPLETYYAHMSDYWIQCILCSVSSGFTGYTTYSGWVQWKYSGTVEIVDSVDPAESLALRRTNCV